MTHLPIGQDRLGAPAAALLASLCACWGFGQVATKIALAGLPPILQMGLRSALAALLVVAYAWARDVRLFERDGTAMAGLLVGSLFTAEFLAIYLGVERTTASRAVLFIYTHPFIVALGGFLLLGERLRRSQLAGLALAFAGVATSLGGSSAMEGGSLAGDALCLLGAALWGATTVLIKRSRLATVAPERTLLWQLGVSALVGLPLAALLEAGRPLDPTPAVLAAFGYGVAVASVTYLLWFRMMTVYPASILSAFTFLTPVFGVAAGVAVLGEPLTPRLVAALVLVAGGIWLVNRPAATPPSAR